MNTPFALGHIKDTPDPRDYEISKVLKLPQALPSVVDHEKEMTPVKNQKSRGACVSFATCALKEWQAEIHKKQPRWLDLSEEWVYDQVRQPGGGAMIRDAMDLLDTQGVCKEWQYPYRANITDDTEDQAPFNPKAAAKKTAADFKASTYARLSSVDEMKQSLALNGVIVIGIDWLNEWFKPNEKINGYPLLKPVSQNIVGGHAICVVGYDETNQVFKFKNSWSESWGKKGYAYFSYDAISGFMSDAWTSIDTQNPQVIQSLREGGVNYGN